MSHYIFVVITLNLAQSACIIFAHHSLLQPQQQSTQVGMQGNQSIITTIQQYIKSLGGHCVSDADTSHLYFFLLASNHNVLFSIWSQGLFVLLLCLQQSCHTPLGVQYNQQVLLQLSGTVQA